MPGTRPNQAVLHVQSGNFNGVNLLAKRLILNYFAKPLIFPNGAATKAAFISEATKLDTLISNAKGNSGIRKQRNAQSLVVFKKIKKALTDVNDTADGDINILTESGFDINYQPEAQGAPELANSVKRVDVGKEENTYKVVLTRKANKPDVEQDPATHQQEVRFDVELTDDTADPTKIKQVIENKPATKLIIHQSQVVANKLNWIRIYAVNSFGRSQPSAWVSFSPKLTI